MVIEDVLAGSIFFQLKLKVLHVCCSVFGMLFSFRYLVKINTRVFTVFTSHSNYNLIVGITVLLIGIGSPARYEIFS